ncbi:aspartate 1-decarboxylase [Brachyspira hampsonii]|uniref:Aspartate 1-decarboxylase n=1 Tax=Brachyspira hampsonii TaxID=1287055 RepID=A0AAC9TVS8_9SPIR|nr:aspartate 1-decarboxylase [Brachyspira hampsonii]ASJ22177.1 aspartate decarboxylase [Brachyspira hampsonii]ELV06025.1 aspartate 1-decarboxylase [Brachyspira hampsonii 30599]MBW5379322.1 aspartate decarboxylase [Brachyspira hampsonii]OEJ19124.1 aspartate decarboxylase [Brachyspira hampsonii]
MMRSVIKSKINRLTVTRTDLNFRDSITIDEALLDKSDIMGGERVSVINLSNDIRFETEVVKGIRGTGIIGINGDNVHYAKKDDTIIILSYGHIPEENIKNYKTKIIFVNSYNMVLE